MENFNAVNAAIGTLFPWVYARKSLPGPGSGNLAFGILQLPFVTPIGAGVANRRQFVFNTPTTYVPHLTGIQGLGGIESGQWRGQTLTVINK